MSNILFETIGVFLLANAFKIIFLYLCDASKKLSAYFMISGFVGMTAYVVGCLVVGAYPENFDTFLSSAFGVGGYILSCFIV